VVYEVGWLVSLVG